MVEMISRSLPGQGRAEQSSYAKSPHGNRLVICRKIRDHWQ